MQKKITIIFIIISVFFVSHYVNKNLFLADSPKINPFFTKNMLAKVSNYWAKTTNILAFKRKSSTNNNISNNSPTQVPVAPSPVVAINLKNAPKDVIDALNAPLTKVSQGVYAGEKNNYTVNEVKTGEIEYLEYTFNIKGKEIKIKVPKGQEPPNQQVMESLYQ